MSENGGPLDPSHYVEHVTRTALLLEQLARDVKALREQTESGGRMTNDLGRRLSEVEKEAAVFKTQTIGKVEINETNIRDLAEKIKWLSRVVVTAIVTGLIGGALALVFKSFG